MSLVLNTLRQKNKSYQDREDDNRPSFSVKTDFSPYDYANGEIGHIIGPNSVVQQFFNIGMPAGIHSFIGKTQSGKTSILLKLGANIVRPYANSCMYLRDAEHTMEMSRIATLTGLSQFDLENKIDYVRYDITHDFVFNDIRAICQAKENLKNEIMIETPFVDMHGKKIKIYPPDVYVLDSLPFMKSLKDDDDISTSGRNVSYEQKEAKVNNNTEGMRFAGSTKLLLDKILDMVFKYNIRFCIVNHIAPNTDMNVQNPKYIQKQLIYLKQTEKLPGGISYLHGNTSILRTDFMSRLEDGEFGPDIMGTRNKMTFVKSKNNISGIPIEVIFDQNTGYNCLLSDFNYIFNRGYGFEGSPRSMYLKAMPSVTFTKRTLWENLVKDFRENPENPQFVKALHTTAARCMYFDLVKKTPDPNPNNWTTGNVPAKVSVKEGVTSR